jgi:hypothetical protein
MVLTESTFARGANPFFNAKTQRRDDSAKRKNRVHPGQAASPAGTEMVERSALVASLRLCVQKIDRHGGREPARMAPASISAGLPESPASAGMTTRRL